MVKLSKKQWIIAGAAAAISIGLAGVYVHNQIKKALLYSYKFSRFKVNKVGINDIDFDVFFTLTNPSRLKYVIQAITTKVYVNNTQIADIANYRHTEIPPSENDVPSVTEIGVNVKIDPKDLANSLEKNWLTIIQNLDKVGDTEITMAMTFKIGYLGQLLSVTVPYNEKFPLKSFFPKK